MNEYIVLGVDIGGSHITISQIDIRSGKLIPGTYDRKDVDSHGSCQQIIAEWAAIISKCLQGIDNGEWRIGIAMPGPVDYDTGISYIRDQDKFEHLYGCNIKKLLAGALQISPEAILMINDAAGFLAGEIFGGVAKGYRRVLGLTLGTGLGSAYSDEGRVIDADLWHSPFMGGRAEDFISARWLMQESSAIRGIDAKNVKDLAALADRPEVKSIFEKFGSRLGQFLHSSLDQYPSEVIVLGGNVARAYLLFRERLEMELQRYNRHTPVLLAETGESAALLGAASLWEPAFLRSRTGQHA